MDSKEKAAALLQLRKSFGVALKESNGRVIDSNLDSLLSAFNKLMHVYTPDDLCANFNEIAQFTALLAENLVHEIRRRANNESTKLSASGVYEFLRAYPADSRGWVLLKSLNFVVSSRLVKILEATCRTSLPSTLIKVFYLFFDLPTEIEQNEVEHRQRLYDSIVTLMITMCSFDSVAEELIQKDDLILLFVGASSSCPDEHSMWRDANFTFLCTILNKSTNASVLKYIHSKGCIGHYIKQLRNQQLDDPETSFFISNLMDLLKISAEYTPLLIEDTINANGFELIVEFCKSTSIDHIKPVLDAMLNIISAGNQTIQLYNPKTPLSFYPFKLNSDMARSTNTIRVPEIFSILEQTFSEGDEEKCLLILDYALKILKMEAMNYFILERYYPLYLFVEKMQSKSIVVQKKTLNLVEFVLRELNFIPCKELSSINNHLREAIQAKDFERSALYLNFLFGILSINVHVKDAYRELLHLETFLNYVQSNCADFAKLADFERELAQTSLDLLVATTKNNSLNAQFITENLEIKCVKAILSNEDEKSSDFRSTTEMLIKQLLFLAKNEQLFSSLLQILFSDPGNIKVCMKILKMFGGILLESHKVRIMFRRSGGYICLMTLLLHLENSLNIDDQLLSMEKKYILEHITLIFRVLSLSMRYEPSNARYFLLEVKPAIIVSIMRTMGCFSSVEKVNTTAEIWNTIQIDQIRDNLKLCHAIFKNTNPIYDGTADKLPARIFCSLYLLRTMFNLAMDNFGKQNNDIQWSEDEWLSSVENVEIVPVVAWTRSTLVHPSPVLCILQLLPAIATNESITNNLEPDYWTTVSQFYLSLVLKALLRSERNQQTMCEHDMPKLVLEVGEKLFKIEKHPLLSSFHYLFERLACQSLHPRELRRFLRLDQPLCCTNLDEKPIENGDENEENNGGPLPIHRVKALVSMLTPRNHSLVHPPPFVEFDLAVEGFACLFTPSLANTSSTQINTTTTNDRLFPPMNGLTYMTWFYLDECNPLDTPTNETVTKSKHSSKAIRLLAILRTLENQQSAMDSHGRQVKETVTGLESYLTCLYVHLNIVKKRLIICTEEHLLVDELQNNYTEPEASEKCAVIQLSDQHLSLRQWTHLSIVLSRSLLKSSQVDVHINERLVGSQKLAYIQPNVGGAQAQIQDASSVHALIGTPPFLRRSSNIRWRMAGTFLVEDVLGSEAIRSIVSLHPHYVGNFQSSSQTPLINEEKILLAITANSTGELNLQILRSMVKRPDADLVASLLGLSINDNSTPMKIMWNCSGHASGATRSLGAIVVGYLGMRTFAPNPVSALLESIGGAGPLLGLVAMCIDSHGLYASLKVLVSAVQTNKAVARAIEQNRGYQTLAVLLAEKMHLFNSHILHLILALAGTVDLANELTIISNQQTFEDLLCDLNLWMKAPDDVKKLLFEHFYELVIDNNCDNLAKVRASSLLNRLLIMIVERPSIFVIQNDILFRLVGAIIQPPCDGASFLRFGQSTASTLPTQAAQSPENLERHHPNLPFHISELEKLLQTQLNTKNGETEQNGDNQIDQTLYFVYARNRLLNIMSTMLAHSSGQVNAQLCETIVNSLGFGWLMALIAPGVHNGTVFLAMRMILGVTKYPQLMKRFKEGSANGGWLQEADSVLRNRAAILLGFSVSARTGAVGSHVDVNPELANCPGFVILEQLIGFHSDQPFAYLTMLALLFNQHNANVQPIEEFNVDMIWSHVFSLNANSSVYDAIAKVDYCPEALIPLFAMLRVGLHYLDENGRPISNESHWSQNYPLMIVQLISFLYQNLENFIAVCHTDTFVIALFTVIIPPRSIVTSQENQTPTVLLGTNNRCSRSILDLLSSILLNDLYLQHDEMHTERLFDALVEFLDGGGALHANQSSLFTDLVNACIERFMSSDMFFANSPIMMPKSAEGQLNQSSEATAVNVIHFLSKIIDSVWSCLYRGNPVKILKCFLKLLAEAHVLNKAAAQLACTETHLTALFRIVLYLLSRPIDNVDTQMSVVDTLAEIIRNQHLLLSSNSNNPLFYGALVHQIFMLSEPPDLHHQASANNQHLQRGSAQVSVCAQSVWGILWQQKKQLLEEIFKRPIDLDLYSARAACGETANRYWLQFVDIQAAGSTSTITNAASLKESARQVGGQLQQQILQSKLSRVARSGLKRLTSKTVLGTGGVSFDRCFIPVQFQYERPKVEPETFHMWIRVHVSLLRELIRGQSQRYTEMHAHIRKWCMQEWQNTEAELTRERGLWGPEERSILDKFSLDVTEGQSRVHKTLVPDQKFYHRYPYRPNLEAPESKPMRSKFAISRDSRLYFERMKTRRFRTMDERIIDRQTASLQPITQNSNGKEEAGFDPFGELNLSMIKRMVKKNRDEQEEKEAAEKSTKLNEDEEKMEATLVDDDLPEEIQSPLSPIAGNELIEGENESEKDLESSSTDPSQSISSNEKSNEQPKRPPSKTMVANDQPDNQTLLRLLEDGEHLHSMFRCARVQGLDTIEGLLLFGRNHFYVVDGFTLLKTREIRDLDFLPEQYHDPIIPYIATGTANRQSTRTTRQCSKFSYDDIREIHKRRYLLQPIALEVFSVDGRNYLLAFPRKIRDRVHQKIASMSRSCTTETGKLISTSEPTKTAGMFLGQLLQLGQQSIVQRWQRGEISNFNYLMYLNTMAGRTYNDLSQYPVFPWILKDYDSDVLDLTNPNTFRVLGKPMGAQTPERLAQFLKRYNEWDDPTGDTPPYMFGTHYSSAMIVLSYLVRMEPFTQQFLKLQGGHFDLADRMFHSIKDAWMSASKNNMADVKELIPEFFYLPEMFQNANNFDLGTKQSGVILDDIILPKWAHGDRQEFIRLHQQALECDYVSEHLHEWIDLIFGYKQTGDSSKDAFNVFHHLFYEENVDFDNIDDPLTRNATFGFINNFGQIPTQLFKKPHPQKKICQLASSTDRNAQTPLYIQIVPGVSCQKVFYHAPETLRPSKKPVKELRAAVGDITINEKNQVIVIEQNKIFLPPNIYISWGFYDRSVRMGQIGSEKSFCLLETNDIYEITCMAAIDSRQIFVGLSTGSILVWTLESGSRRATFNRQSQVGHTTGTTSTLASAAVGATASISGVVTNENSSSSGYNAISSSRHRPTMQTKKVLAAHTDGVTALAICANFNFIVSASRDHTAVIWHLNQFTYIRQLKGHSAAVSAVCANETTGDIATASGSFLFLWTLNGVQLACVNTAEAGLFSNTSSLILCLSFSTLNGWDCKNVVMCGTKDGLVKFYSIEFQKGSNHSDPNPKTNTNPIIPDHKTLKEHFLKRQRKIQHSHGSRLSSREISEDSQSISPTPSSTNAEEVRLDNLGPADVKPSEGWHRICKLRRVLTEHTAYNSRDNQRPAPITSIAPSKDHRNLFVGDGAGRVWMWSMDQGTNNFQDLGLTSPINPNPSTGTEQLCVDCRRPFAETTSTKAVASGGVAKKQINCKNCGQWCCENCISEEVNSKISARPIQVCGQCSILLRQLRSH